MLKQLSVFSALVSTCFASHAKNELELNDYNHPGGIIELNLEKQSDQLPVLKFGLADPTIIEYKDHWRVIVGVSLDTLPGQYVLYYKPSYDGATGEYIEVSVQQKLRPFIKSDRAENQLNAISLTHTSFSELDYSNTQQPDLPLLTPVNGVWTENFGHQFFDEKAGTILTPNSAVLISSDDKIVTSPQSAIVSKVTTDQSGVSTVYLDHGRGLYSVLIGISDLTIEAGNGIVAGAVLGRLIDDDFSSSNKQPKLIWQTVVNGAYVNPSILTKLEP